MNFSLTPYSIYDIPVSASEPIIWMLLTDTDMWILIQMNGMSQLYINLLDFYTDLNMQIQTVIQMNGIAIFGSLLLT